MNGKSVTASGLFPLSDAGSWTCPAAAGAYSFEVVYERRSYQVTATGAPAEGGTVSGGGTVQYGDDAQVAYAAAPGWHVAAVTVDGARWPVDSFPTGLTLTQVTANREVAVTFERNAYPLTLTVSDGAGATIEGPASVVHGASATATWKARPGYVVTAVTVDGVAHDPADFGDVSAGSCEFPSVAEAHGVHVTVQRKTYPVATAVTEGNGAVSPSTVVAHGEKAKVTWKAADGWRVDTVTVDGTALAGDAAQAGSYLFENVDAAHRVEVSFARQNYLIETFADLTLGTITSSTEVPYESDFTVRWSPSATAYVEGAQVDGEPMEDEEALEQGAYTFRRVGAAHRFAVAFKPLPDKALVATAAVGPGAVWLEGTDESAFDPGTDVTVRWAPEEGHEVAAAVLTETDGDGNVVENRPLTDEELAAGAGEGFVLRNLAEGCVYRVTVSFAPQQFTVATESVGRGTCTATFQEAWGKSATVSFAPEPGWRVARVMVDGIEDAAALAAGSVRFAALAADHEVRVEFEQIFHRASVACEPAEGGAVTLNGAPGASASAAEATLEWGSAATFGWRPAEGWRVAAVTVNGSDRPGLAQGAAEYTVGALQEDVAVRVAFERIPLAITCSASDPAAVAFTAPATVLFGDAATVGWKVKQGWSISRVLVNGAERPELIGADGAIFARVTADQTVHVEVSRDVFPVDTAIGGPHADRATISAPANVAYGDDHTVSWTVEEGFMASSVTVDGVERPELAGPDAPRFWTFSDVRGPHSVVVEVEKAPEVYTVAVRKVGSVVAQDTMRLPEGSTVTIVWPAPSPAALPLGSLPLMGAGGEMGAGADASGGAAALAETAAGSNRRYVVTMPEGGHVLKSVTVDGADDDLKAEGAYTFEDLGASHVITFEFEKDAEPDPPTPPKPDDPDDPTPPTPPGSDDPEDPRPPTPDAPDSPTAGEPEKVPSHAAADDRGGNSDRPRAEGRGGRGPSDSARLAQTGDRSAATLLCAAAGLAATIALLARRRRSAKGER